MPEAIPEPVTGTCPLCGNPVAAVLVRCSSCGFSLAGVDGRPGPFSRATLLWTAIGFLAVYLVTLGVVALAR
jgi:hypothetical protein